MTTGSKRIQRSSPIHLVLLADNSGSMRAKLPGSELSAAQHASRAIREWVGALQAMTKWKKSYFKFTLIVFEKKVDAWLLAEDVNALNVDELELKGVEQARTNLTAALDKAIEVLRTTPTAATDCPPYVFLYSDGNPDDADSAVTSAEALKALELPCGKPTLVTIGFGAVDAEFMRSIATFPAPTPRNPKPQPLYKQLDDAKQLMDLLPRIGTPKSDLEDFNRQLEEA